MALSDTEIVVQFVDIGVEFGIGEFIDNTPMFHDVIAIRDGRGETEILLHQENGKALFLERPDDLTDC